MKEHYYLFPIKPGIRNTLAGTMGELRRTHFHTGIDIRTAGVQGVPVLAAANGYISRIVVSPGGYGNVLYMTHGNGQVTVYGHLKSFYSPIKEYVREEQYERQTFALSLFPEKNQFSFLKGDTIALSGNSGSSGGPHLHFEIRNSEQMALNPLEYGFKEIVDGRSPEVRTITFTTIGQNSRVNNQFGKIEVKVTKQGNNYVLEDTIRVYGKIGVELLAFDRQDWTRFRTGINEISMTLDGVEQFRQEITQLSFAKSRNFYNYVNYEELYNHGKRLHKLYVDDGNQLDFYSANEDRGLLTFTENCESLLEITLYDSYRNESTLSVNLICEKPSLLATPTSGSGVSTLAPYHLVNNTLVFHSDRDNIEIDEMAVFYSNGDASEVQPVYSMGKSNVYLWDLSGDLPDSVILSDSVIPIQIDAMIPPDIPFHFYSDYLEAKFKRNTLFDTAFIFVEYEERPDLGEVFSIGPNTYPVRGDMELKLHPRNTYDDKERTHVYKIDQNNNVAFAGGEWDGGNINFKTKSFGEFTILTDSIPPFYKPLIVNQNRLVFRIHDRMSGIKAFEVRINNNWILMNYDPKLKQIWSDKIHEEEAFTGPMTLTIEDNAGNVSSYQTIIHE